MSNSSIMKRESSVSENSDVQLVHDLYRRSKTENIPNLNPRIDITNEDENEGNNKNKSMKFGTQTALSPHIRINDNDEEKPIFQKAQQFTVKPPKNFERFSQTRPEIPNNMIQSQSGTDSSLDDYTQSKKLAKTTRNSISSSKKKIETLTLNENKPNVNYRNSKIISFGKKQNTTHQNFTEYNPEKSIIKEEGEDQKMEKNEMDDLNQPINSLFTSPKKALLDTASPCKSPKKSKILENPPETFSDINGLSPKNNNNNPACDAKFNSKFYKLISQFYIVKKFMTSLINATIYRKPKKLKSLHYTLINDWSVVQNYQYKNGLEEDDNTNNSNLIGHLLDFVMKKIINYKKKFQRCSKCLKFSRKILKYVIHPNNAFKMLWDILHLFLILLYLIIIPLNLTFKVNILDYYSSESPGFFFWIRAFSFCFFIMDLLINFNTAFYDKGELIENRQIICRNYIKTQFLSDIISIFYLYDQILRISMFNQLIPPDSIINFIGLLFILRVSNLNKIISRIEEFFFVEEKYYNTFSLFRLICFVIFVSHLFACAWYYVAYVRMDYEITWLQYYRLTDDVWLIKYIYSFYYVVIVMNTVGFGDIVPQTNTERVYSIFFIYVACGIFAYVINCIGLVLQDINKKTHNLKKTILLINAYMKEKNINIGLRIRIRKYIEYIWQEERGQNESETQSIINKLSRNLKEELLLNANGIVLREFPLFYMNFSEDSLRKLVYHIKEINLTPGDMVYGLNELEEDQCLYIVRKGEIELFVDTPRNSQPFTILRTLKENELFGEYSFFSEMPRETSARSSGFTTLFFIRKADFMPIIKSNSDDHEIYCQLKDRINLYQETEGLYQICPACQQNDHNIINCSMLHLNLSKHRILQRYNHSRDQIREPIQRIMKKNPHALKNFERHENLAQKFTHDLNSDDSDDDSSDVSTNNIKMEIKKEFNRLDSDVTNDPMIINNSVGFEDKNPASSPKFKEGQRKKSILRFPSKLGPEGDSLLSNKNLDNTAININSPIDDNNNNNSSVNIRKPRSSMRRKPGTTVAASLNRQASKDSLSKNSIYSKKSSKSNKSIKFYPYEVSLTQNTNEDIRDMKRLALLKDIRTSNRELSNLTSNRQKTDDDFSEYMVLLKKEKGKNQQNVSEYSNRSKSHKSKESKKSSNKSKDQQFETLNPIEKPTTTLLDIDKINYDDIAKSYEFYFPYNNLENVMEKIRVDSAKKKKKKNINRVNTKNNEKTDTYINYEGIDVIISPYSVTKFKRRGGKIEIFKKTNFFKRRISMKKASFDKKKLKKMLIEKGKENIGLFRVVKGLVNTFYQKILVGGVNWVKEKILRIKKKEVTMNIVLNQEK